jgi:hypothetical protein
MWMVRGLTNVSVDSAPDPQLTVLHHVNDNVPGAGEGVLYY